MATALTRLYGANCYSIYEAPADTPKEECFVKEFLWAPHKELKRNSQALRNIILSNRINCVIVQGAFIHAPRFRAAIEGLTCKIILAHHFEPRSELVFGRFSKIIKYRPKSIVDFARWIKRIIMHPLTAMEREQQLSSAYRAAYECSDHVVLLCQSFIKPFSEFAGLQDTSKFVVIPNGLSFDVTPWFDKVSKHKVVLIVSRLDEVHKRLSLALRIWARVKQSPVAKEWTLRIVGDGNDRELYERIIHEEQIPDVFLEGRKDPIPYYEKASIFMMTSRSEAWGLTLTEAQQMGVVPMAFDTYASLREIITDGENGAIIMEGDVGGYEHRMKELMSNSDVRQQMARQAMASSLKYSPHRIADLWWKLLVTAALS
ncbi:glycosyltransferase [Vulcanococcus limneticus Candia 3F8]|uniref:glycosyltransferase n=1 Tax=Vulcanococcus limneticus TaxID=2170428 RepID=UPI0018E29D2A|nr:glycosyltransferase [Vulcanococcus limneticus]MCP9791131.1 glycosyltransferase [Vulcanococcus limneticus MW73D5]MCP9893719.1 glycosyltransferase [Vulcanococcus limneticus Candia 3F8]MCP9896529.1 glycosyltransferase [Vulcanococcus limneticus Candia 3B3]